MINNSTAYRLRIIKAYALHSLSLVRARPNRGEKTAAISHKQNVMRHLFLNVGDIGKYIEFEACRLLSKRIQYIVWG